MAASRGSYSRRNANPANIASYRAKRKYTYKPKPIGVCLHCSTESTIYPRGLCFRCYKRPYIRERYATQEVAYREPKRARLPRRPTTAKPGTPEKIAVMMERAAAKRQLFHPGDAR